MFVIDDRQIRHLAARLKDSPKAVGYAARNTLNRQAFDARKAWQGEMRSTFTLRNTWTMGSIRVEKASGYSLQTMQSRVGSGLNYLETQEEGGAKPGGGAYGQPIPTSVASGEGRGARPRKRTVRARYKLGAITLQQRPGGSRKQRNAAAIQQARRKGTKYAFLELGKGTGIAQIPKGKRGKIQLIWSLAHSGVKVPPHPTLGPAVAKVQRRFPRYAAAELLRQLKRAKLA